MKLIVLTACLGLLFACASGPGPQAPIINAETSAMKLSEASLAIQMQDYTKAIDLVKSSIRFDPNNAKAHSVAGLLYQRQGLSQQATEYFSRAIKIAPDDPAIRNNFGNYLCAERKYAAAEENFLIAANTRGNAQPDTALTNAGLCALRANEKNRAKDFFTKAIQYNSGQTTALYQLALMSQQNADAITASGFLQHYLSHKPHTAKTLMLAAGIESDLGNNSSYRALLKQIVTDFPDSPEAVNAEFNLKSQAISNESSYQEEIINITPDQAVISRPVEISTYEPPATNISVPATLLDNEVNQSSTAFGTNSDWILARDHTRYTIQIYTAGNISSLDEISSQLSTALVGTPKSFGFKHKGEQKFTLIAGDFENASDARAALVALPDDIKQYQPWIRRFDSIQRVINTKGIN